jgi:hypothetical protein
MKDLKQILKEFKENANGISGVYNGDDNFFVTYESVRGFNSNNEYFCVYFRKLYSGKTDIEISMVTDCVDYVLNIIKEIEPKAVVISYKTTKTHEEVIN